MPCDTGRWEGTGILIASVSGIPAFVLGNGPTLPVDDLGCLSGQFTIGVNRIMRSGFVPTVILWVDNTVYGDDGEQIDNSGALLVCDLSLASRQYHIGLETWVGGGAFNHDTTPTELCVNGNTGCCAARWAIALGFDPVYLVGMGAVYLDGKTDFYGENRWHHKTAPDDDGTLPLMRREMRRLRSDCDVLEIPDGEILRSVAEPLVDHEQKNLRNWLQRRIT